MAVGELSKSTGTGGVAIGAGSSASEDAVAVGDLSNAVEKCVAIGDKAGANFKSQLVIQTDSESNIAPIDTRTGLYTDSIDSVAAAAANDYRINYNSDRKELFMENSNTNYNP